MTKNTRPSDVSREEVMEQLRLWQSKKSKINALFTSSDNSVRFSVVGRILLSEDGNEIWVAPTAGKLYCAFPFVGESFERAEPLLDAPEEIRWKLDFFLGFLFKFPFGSVALFEIAE